MSKLKSKIWVFAAAVVLLAAASVFYFSYASVDARTGRYLALADKFISEGKYEEAILNYEKILEIDENNIPARVGLVKAYVKTGDAGNASDMLREIEILKPASGEQLAGLLDIVDELGTLLTDTEDETPGDRSYEALMSLFPDNMEIVSAYSDFLVEKDNMDEAVDLLEGYAKEPGNEDLAEKLAMLKIPALVPDHAEGEYEAPCRIAIPVPDKTALYYTLDGTEPNVKSTKYQDAIELPVGEIQLKVLPVLENGLNGRVQTFKYSIKEVVLEPDLFIPELGKTQDYTETYPDGTVYKAHYTWEKGSDSNSYTEKYTYDGMGEGQSIYEFTDDSLLLREDTFGWYESEYVTSQYIGNNIMANRCRKGEGWNCKYTTPAVEDDGGVSSPYEEYESSGKFVGMEDVRVDGTVKPAYHIHVAKQIKSDGITYNQQIDFWLVKEYGIVRRLIQSDNGKFDLVRDGFEQIDKKQF